jgi:hypothetical protein
MNLSIAFTLSIITSIVFAAFSGAMYGILTFIITLPIFLFVTHNIILRNNRENGKQAAAAAASAQAANTYSRTPFAWPELSKFQFEIDGEPQYQPILKQLATHTHKAKNKDGKQPVHTAYLIPDEEHKLVQVKIDNQTVGFFNISDTRSFRRRLSAKKLAGQITTCRAIIADGYKEQSRKKYYSVMLDMRSFT